MQHVKLETKIVELRTQRSVLMAQPPSTLEDNFALDLKMIDLDMEANELEDQLERESAWTFLG